MRTRLNILCVLVLLLLGWLVMESAGALIASASMGAQVGRNAGKEKEHTGETPTATDVSRFANMHAVSLHPSFDADLWMTDSVYNEKSGSYVPATYLSLVVSVPAQRKVSEMILLPVVSFLQIGCTLWALVLFVRLVISVNRFDIFTWRNVRRLRLIGLGLVLAFGCNMVLAFMEIRSLEEVLSLRGYELSLSEMLERTTLLLGLCSLIVGEVFAIGLRMKEEQDLTI